MKRGTPDHPKMLMLAAGLKRIGRKTGDANLVTMAHPFGVGIMEMLWHWAGKYAIQGDVGKWSNEVIADALCWSHEPDDLIELLVEARWLDRAADPHRLVIHDIQDHADNTWRQNLVDAGLKWWNGGHPRRENPGRPKNSRETPGKLQTNSSETPQPEPEPEPEPVPEPEIAASAVEGQCGAPRPLPPPRLPDAPSAETLAGISQLLHAAMAGRALIPPGDDICVPVYHAMQGASVEDLEYVLVDLARTRTEPPRSYKFFPGVIRSRCRPEARARWPERSGQTERRVQVDCVDVPESWMDPVAPRLELVRAPAPICRVCRGEGTVPGDTPQLPAGASWDEVFESVEAARRPCPSCTRAGEGSLRVEAQWEAVAV